MTEQLFLRTIYVKLVWVLDCIIYILIHVNCKQTALKRSVTGVPVTLVAFVRDMHKAGYKYIIYLFIYLFILMQFCNFQNFQNYIYGIKI